MRTETGKAVHLSDYRVPDYLVDRVELNFSLNPTETLVTCRLLVRPNPQGRAGAQLQFDGDELNVLGVEVDGRALDDSQAMMTPQGLTIMQPPQRAFTLTTRTSVNPTANTQLSGLYRSCGVYCTQCEAEGFRRITYFPDRPDVLSVYTTRIEAAKEEAPILLGNGDPLTRGDLSDGRHFAIWHDPHPKPCYLFALVGGNLGCLTDSFTTISGKKVKLGIYVEPGKEARARYAMDALKRSMKWDEDVFGREYDLDVFNIVAVSDFNMGAMENKGLNIFNDKYVLASPETATDSDYAYIEAIIAHEYFHNWTGNRITCRDWFQLCLKEGLTVYRDQEFSADQRSRPVKRIADVRALRSAQFPEDSGPLAHSVRPEIYHEINNFYTATVYQKGAEVIRTLRHFIGDEAFRQGMDLYFARHDGHAATVEDFIDCFAQTSGLDLNQFMLWYKQAGTPIVKADAVHDADARTLTIELSQSIPPTPGQAKKLPHVIPVKMGLIAHDGRELKLRTPAQGEDGGASAQEIATSTFILSAERRRLKLLDVGERPALSLFRSFSAPVRLEVEAKESEYLTLARHDSDLFNRWQAIQTCASRYLVEATSLIREGREVAEPRGVVSILESVLAQADVDYEFAAQALSLPGDSDIAREIEVDVDPQAIFTAGRGLRRACAQALAAEFTALYERLSHSGRWSADSRSAGQRALRAVSLAYIMAGHPERGARLAIDQFRAADNMTDRMSALATLTPYDCAERESALAEFHDAFKDDHIVMDKWFALQAMIPDTATLGRVRELMRHPLFSMSNPNRFRSLVSTFALANPTQFNATDGSGYEFIVGLAAELDQRNPQIAARLLVAFRSWKSLEPTRRAHAQAALRLLAGTDNLSADVRDILTRSLA